ncbi:MAG: glycosyltransferase [Caldilineaceae bacterium]|nr:glycosyltransferase [Caldilineaceae bacterium]
MATPLNLLALALLALLAWKHWTIVRFFRRPAPVATRPLPLVSILQPILSGDVTLPATLAHNLRMATDYPLEFIWLVDEDDPAAQAICRDLVEALGAGRIQLLLLPAAPQGHNPKTFKLLAGQAVARGEILCVLDDDTMLPDYGLEQCLPFLDRPGAGLVFGLPYQVNFANLWSSLAATFVNSSSLLTYIPYTTLHTPVTINGMFYAVRRGTWDEIGGWRGVETILADDFAVAMKVRQRGLELVQTPLCHAISTHITGMRPYLRLMQRWFIFPRESLMRHLPGDEQALVYALALAPALAPLLLVIGLLVWPSALLAGLVAAAFIYQYTIFAHCNVAYLRQATPWRWSWLVPALQLVVPLQLLAALLLPQRITWRGHVMEVQRGGSFRFVQRRAERRRL